MPFLLRRGIRLLSVTLVLGLLSLTMPAAVVSSSEVPSIDAEPRIIGIPSPGGGLIGLIPGQDKLLLGGSFPLDQLRSRISELRFLESMRGNTFDGISGRQRTSAPPDEEEAA